MGPARARWVIAKEHRMYIGGSLVGLIILILDLIAIVEILQSGRAVGEKLLWILLILLLPLVGVLLYFLIGRK